VNDTVIPLQQSNGSTMATVVRGSVADTRPRVEIAEVAREIHARLARVLASLSPD
jgi:hypothetical protein